MADRSSPPVPVAAGKTTSNFKGLAGYGLCGCGCGERTKIITVASRKYGHVVGQPYRFIAQHHGRSTEPAYHAEDRGYATPCWVWQRACDPAGYGQLKLNGAHLSAHRHYYEQANGPIPNGLTVDHLCRVRNCVNPDHMELVTAEENRRRAGLVRLTREQAREIRASQDSLEVLAVRYGVVREHVREIRAGRTWREAPDG